MSGKRRFRWLSPVALPFFLVAVLSGAIGYGVMNFLMTSTPIAMQVCGHPYSDAAFVISSHIIGMFAPSFFTGQLIRRLGVLPVMAAGVLCNFGAIGIALSGVAVSQFWFSLVLLGVGWNFLYLGGTTLLTETYRPEERARAQGTNEQAIFIMMALSSFTSGMTVTTAGWERVVPGGDCQCADGSEFSFWQREADPSKVVLFLQDGRAVSEMADPTPTRVIDQLKQMGG